MTEKHSVAHAGLNPDKKTRNDTSNKMRMDPTDREAGGLEAGAKKPEHGSAAAATGIHASPKKRRKVNHGKRYWFSPSLSRAVQGLWKAQFCILSGSVPKTHVLLANFLSLSCSVRLLSSIGKLSLASL